MNKGIIKIIILLSIPFLLLLSQVFALESCPDPNNVTECCIMDKPGGYKLTTDIKASGDCFIINASYIDCRGHKIIGDGSGVAINISNKNQVYVINCTISNFTTGINIEPDANAAVIRYNKIHDNDEAILFNANPNLPPSYSALIYNNIIINNLFGVHIRRSEKNKIYNNYFANNKYNAYDDSGYENYWNTTKTSGTNIIEGPYIGGNYWDDYTGLDLNGDGLGDTSLPYDSQGWILIGGDYSPLVDINPPRYSNITLSNSSLTTYTLNITWKDNIRVDKVIIELDGINYTDLQKINETQILIPAKIEHSVTYSKTFENLAQGTHYYRWYANDTRNNWNSTQLLNFTVNFPGIITSTSSTIPIPEGCRGNVTLTLSPNPAWIGKKVTATISGLSDCSGRIATVSPKLYHTTSCRCKVIASGCSCSFSAYPIPGEYVYYAKVDLNGDEVFDENEVDEENLTVICQNQGDACDAEKPCCPPYYCINGTCQAGMGGGCPILKAWNGREFKEIEKLNIHSKEGVDTVYSTSFKMKPLEEDVYKIILEEKWYLLWEGSHIDSVKLIDSNGKECDLIKAIHSKLGDVTSLIKESDDKRVETKPGESIELIYTGCGGEEFELEIEGYNPWRALVKLGLSYRNLPLLLISILIAIVAMFGVFKLFKTTIKSS